MGPGAHCDCQANANGQAETVEDIVSLPYMVAFDVLHTLHRVVCEEIEDSSQTDQFKNRVEEDKLGSGLEKSEYRDEFVASIKEDSAMRVRVYEEKAPVYFTVNANRARPSTTRSPLCSSPAGSSISGSRTSELTCFR